MKNTLKMNCLGDSITYGYINKQGEAMEKSYPTVLKEILDLETVRNYGINGSTIADGKNPMYIRYKDMDDDANIISVLAGTNDFGKKSIDNPPLGTKEDNKGNTVYGALNILCKGLKQKYPNALIFFMTPLRCENDTIPNKCNYTLEDVKEAIEEICSKYEIPILDLYSIGDFFPEDKIFLKQYGIDGVHPNQKFVKEILSNKIANFIKENIED
ncbi:MAG: SGNH/GDSL hydrolase family protein [Clostridia bacterium]|nr:SGNH/GDSL hydrolase family protein [Clostridia bacterium]